jgi:FkbM family methyltransferase
MLGKISRFTNLFKIYKAHAFHLLVNPVLGKPIWIPMNGRKFYLNFDKATYYHLIHSIDKVKKLVDSIPVQADGIIIDGGANHGLFSLLAHQRFPDKKIFALEPYPKILPLLRKNLEGTGVTIVEKALAGKNGTVSFFTSESSDQMGSTIRENVQEFISKKETVKETTVPAVSLATLVADEKIEKIAVLKLDVQGGEFSIIEHADEVLAITDFLILEITLLEKTALDLIEKARKFFPYHQAINPVAFGADMLFSKQPADSKIL